MSNNGRELTGTIEYSICPTGTDLANVFWHMSTNEQVEFFNHLGKISSGMLATQLQSVTDSTNLDHHGRWAMSCINEYATPYDEQLTDNVYLDHNERWTLYNEYTILEEQYETLHRH